MEGCGFRDQYESFEALGIEIVGVGFGSPESNADWANEQGYQYEVWSDTDKTLAVYYGAANSTSAVFPNRITRLLDSQGHVLLEYDNVDAGTSPGQVLNDCQAIFGN